MVEKTAFAFWQEKDRQSQENGPSNNRLTPTKRSPVMNNSRLDQEQTDHPPKGLQNAKSLPGHNFSSFSTLALGGQDNASSKSSTSLLPEKSPEMPRPIRRDRPHSVMVLSKKYENKSNPPATPLSPQHASSSSSLATGSFSQPRPLNRTTSTSPAGTSTSPAGTSTSPAGTSTSPAGTSNTSSTRKVSFDLKSKTDTVKSVPSSTIDNRRVHPVTLSGSGHSSNSINIPVNGTDQYSSDIKSAPPTTTNRRPYWSMKSTGSLDQGTRNQSVSPTDTFVSYTDEFTDSVPHSEDNNREGKKCIARSSPVVTKVPKIRHYSAQSVRKETVRVMLRERKVLIDPLIEEVEAFWKIVRRIIAENVKESIYLTSPAISRFTPPSGSSSLSSSSINRDATNRTPSFLNMSSTHPSDVTLEVELGPIVKGVDPIQLTCAATSLVSEAIEDVLNTISQTYPTVAQGQHNYQLKVCGKDEYFESDRCLLDYQYTHTCIKLNVPISLVLMERSFVKQIISRTTSVNSEMPLVFAKHALSFHELTTLIDSYFSKEEEFRGLLSKPPVNYARMCHMISACVRLICERMGFVEPVRVSEAIFDLQRACQVFKGNEDFSMAIQVDEEHLNNRVSTINPYQLQDLRDKTAADVANTLDNLKTAIKETIELYCQHHHCSYEPMWYSSDEELLTTTDPEMKFRVNIRGLHRLPVQEFANYNTFKIEVGVYHGGKPICKKAFSPPAKMEKKFFDKITWDKWVKTGLPLAQIPREAKMCFTLYGLNPPTNPKDYVDTKEPLAWVSKQLFTSSGRLVSGYGLLGMWRDDSPADPIGTSDTNMNERKCLLLEVDFDDYRYQYGVTTSSSSNNLSSNRSLTNVTSPARPPPPQAIAMNMKDFVSKDRFERLSDKDLRSVWSHRNQLPILISSFARGLPVFAQALPSWSKPEDVSKFHNLLSEWPVVDPSHGLELLDAQFSDLKIRLKASEMISQFCEDDFLDLLPQILQSLKHDCYLDSSMHELILKQAITSPRTAHYLYWNLVPLTSDDHFGWRYQLLLSAVLAASGEELAMEFAQQRDFVKSLADIANNVKNTRDLQRQSCLVHSLQELSASLPPVFRLPLDPALQCCDIDFESCSFFNSKTVPLKLAFKNADPFGKNVQVMFKVGDDLRQDMLALQLMQLMDKIWLRAGLDMRLILYQVLATGEDQGFVELVTESSTLRQIQTQHGLTGSFKDKPLWEWLMRHNSSDAAWKRATENFTHSCAGCCVATYVLGICDRHNDNIMVKKSGHMFHIDFGKILGNAQMFGSIKRDRAPFVLTPDMAYVINAGDKPSVKFQKFTDLCCAAYNELRKHSHLFLSLLSLLLTSNMPELSSIDDIKFVRDALLPSASEEEATFHFTKHIEASLSSLSTQINFFIHNLAQYKFSSPATSQSLLSFCPTCYSILTDSKITSAVVVAYHLRYFPEKYIVYQIQIHRSDPNKPSTILFRRYSEFNELHHKLLESFPEDNLPTLPGKTFLPGQSRAKETSERRREYLSSYLDSLLNMDPKISESDVVYTFLHCLLRDEQDLIKMREEEQALVGNRLAGKVKLDLRYNEQNKRFSIMVQHVQSLVPREGVESTDPYVKLYLIPDPSKLTKLKTKIARKTLNPTYNETLHYTLSSSELKSKSLQLTVWDASSLLSKECLGIAIIELDPIYRSLVKGYVDWFELQSTQPPPPSPLTKS